MTNNFISSIFQTNKKILGACQRELIYVLTNLLTVEGIDSIVIVFNKKY
jgi:hypothetical protein